MNTSYQLITILGPTAVGKTRLAAKLASKINGEIISADSRQVYRGMNLGTGKDYKDYEVDGVIIPYYLIDIVDPGYKYNVFEFQNDFFNVYNTIIKQGKMPVMCGGSGLYLESVLDSYKLISVPKNEELRHKLSGLSLDDLTKILKKYKKLHNTTDIDTIPRALRAIEIEVYYTENRKKENQFPKINSLIIGVNIDRVSRRRRITERLQTRLNEGMIDEVENLLKKGLTTEDLIYYGLEYKFIALYLAGELTYDQMFQQLETAIHQFAKRQMTWFRRMERNGFNIHWLDAYDPIEIKLNKIINWMNS